MKVAEYCRDVLTLLGRIKNTATMINSYVAKFHHHNLLLAKDSPVATAAIRLVNESEIPDQVQAMFWVDSESIDTSKFPDKIEELERRLKTLNRICMQYQELHAMFVKQGKIK